MINTATMEGTFSEKPVLLESSRAVPATEFNLEHTDLTGTEPLVYVWRCRATGQLAKTICERAMKGQAVVVAGKFVQETVSHEGKLYPVVKLRVEHCAFGRVKATA
jgi:hypothetical protein